MKKSLRKLIPTFVMLIITAALIGTSTFAWFSMNNTVSVNSMEITAKSNTTYLLVSSTNTTASAIQTEQAIEITDSSAAKAVYPVAPGTVNAATYYVAEDDEVIAGTKEVGDLKTPVSHTAYDTSSPATLAWYTMIGTSPDSDGYVGKATTEQAVTNPDLEADYVLKSDFYFTIAAGAEDAENLYVSKVTFTGCDAAVRCLVVGETNSVIFSATDLDGDSSVILSGTTGTITDASVVHVVVYIYYDGNASTIYTNNIDSILGGNVSLEFSVSVA